MRARRVPDEILFNSLKIPEKCVELHTKRSNRPRLTSFAWYQHAYNGKLFRIDRLQLEFPQSMCDLYRYFESNNGDIIAFPNNICMHRDGFPLGARHYEDEQGSFMATIEETDDAYIGYPYKSNGHIALKKISLSKSEWHVKLQSGDKLVGLHIPADEPFTDEIVEATLKKSREFLKTCYPNYNYKAFFCCSWLLDPSLIDILGENSNISKFCKRFITVGLRNNGRDVFGYVFKAYEDNIDIAALPENTRLQKALKQHLLNDKSIYVMHGVFF